MPKPTAAPLTRRRILTAGGAFGLGAVVVACGGDKGDGKKVDGAGTTAAAKNDGPWEFEDDRGKTAKAGKVPANIVAFTGVAAALHDYGVEVKGVFGPTKTKDGKADVQAGDMDVSKVEVLGNVWGEFNVEKFAALRPDALISTMFDDKGTFWYVPEESADSIMKLVPNTAVGISVYDTPLPKPLARMAELAKSLGADLDDAKITAAKKRFEDAAAKLRAAAKSRPEIKVLIGSGSADIFYVSGVNLSADLEYFKELGVNIVEPPKKALAASGGWFENLSWENVDTYDADIIMLDNRTGTLQNADLKKAKPTWAKLPAVKAGQVIPRVTEPIYSYDKCAPILEDLAKAIENAKKVS
ncbi:ABC transporter substrate-binding protein [Streptomyces sp. NPDC060194]|uniref:ABC transporter substrate-binding protein n=1 Tax=Streptomyces sp. NPDC060194 TaxID=3347069 RepID=UPI003666B417